MRFIIALISCLVTVTRSDTLRDNLLHTLRSEQEQELKFSVDCYKYTSQSKCETTYCVWNGSKCGIAPLVYNMLCSLYCDAGPGGCVKNDQLSTCQVNPRIAEENCPLFQSAENCEAQTDQCTSHTKSGGCAPAPTCCARTAQLCESPTTMRNSTLVELAKQGCGYSKKKVSTTNGVMKLCGNLAAIC